MAVPVPFAKSLSDIYTEDALPEQKTRWSTLLSKFESKFGHPPDFVARSPGRVNIIGEHIDYSLYSVLPMAITADCIIATSTNTGIQPKPGTYKIQIANILDKKFPSQEFDIPLDSVEIDNSKHEWTNYFKSGLRGAIELLRKKHGKDFKPQSMQVLMDGTVPAGGGLSSSAAFTSTSALAVMVANGEKKIDKTELTELAIVSERAVGVNSGGMDQAASVFSERGSALFVSFSPKLVARPVFFPETNPELCFLIAQSFVAADKALTGPIHYNLRVVECSLAAAYLNAVLNPPSTPLLSDAGPLGISLHGFHETYFANQEHHNNAQHKSPEAQLEELIELTSRYLDKEEGYTRQEISSAIGLPVEQLEQQFMHKFPVRAEKFKLRQRALHVFTEALRVRKFLDLLEKPSSPATANGSNTSTEEYNSSLGAILNQTQDSCRDTFECSCPELDALCAIARKAGSYGSRVTGAGWGGCSVHLVPAEKVDVVRQAWDEQYYSKMDLTEEQRAGRVVESRPGGGSAVFVVEESQL